MKSMLQIGADVKKVSANLPALTKYVLAVLNTSASDEAKKSAIEALCKLYGVTGVTVSNCHFESK